MRQERRLVRNFLDYARRAWRDLTQDGREDRLPPMRNRRHLHDHVVVLERDVAIAFTERPLGLEQVGIDQPFDDNLRIGRHFQIDRDALRYLDGRARRSARHRHFIHVRGEFLRPGVDYNRRAADHDRAWHRLAQRAVLLPVKISARASDTRGHAHAEPVGFFQRCAVGPHIAHPGLGIARDAKRGSEIGRGVETRSGNRHRQACQPATRPPQIFTLDDHFLAQWGIYQDRGNGVGDCSRPSRADLFDLTAHPNRINLGRSGERPDDDRNIIAPSVRVDDIGEQKSAAVFLWNAAQKLAPHEWMQLGVFVDWPFNTNEQAVRFELSEVRLEIKAWPGKRLLGVTTHWHDFYSETTCPSELFPDVHKNNRKNSCDDQLENMPRQADAKDFA